VGDLTRSVKDTEKELAATDARLSDLEQQRAALQEAATQAAVNCQTLREHEEGLKAELAGALAAKYKLLLATSRQQKQAKRYEDMAAGRYKPLADSPEALDAAVASAGDKLGGLLAILDAVRSTAPHLGGELDKILCHVADV
jgi:chromosome segregation ATPase